MMITIFKNIFSKEPFYISVDEALERIKNGKSKTIVEEIRKTLDKDKANKLKSNLPSVCFSGKFDKDRTEEQLIEHSGFLVLDFDNIEELRDRQTEIISHDFIYACWVSPSGKGLKALIKILSPKKHRQHFEALQQIFPDVDKSGINVSRVCYESYDSEIYINKEAATFGKIKKVEKVVTYEKTSNDEQIFQKILIWLSNKNEAFVTGERNNFIFKLAAACCRFGLSQEVTESFIDSEFISRSDFTKNESSRAIKSAYKMNNSKFGSAVFDKEILTDKVTLREIPVDETVFDE
jgi:hypothetical protein